MRRHQATVLLLISSILVSIHFAEAQKIKRIGYLSAFDPADDSARFDGIRLALRELGYIEGQNTTVEYQYSEAKVDRARAHAV